MSIEQKTVQTNPSTTQNETGFPNSRLNLNLGKTLTTTSSEVIHRFTATVDWVRLEGVVSESQYRDIMLSVFDFDPFHVDHDANLKRYKGDPGFKHKATGTAGQYICWNVDGKRYEVAVCLPGKWLETHRLMETLKVLRWLVSEGLHCTRTDCAVDDHSKVLDIHALIQAIGKGNFAGFQSKDIHLSGDMETWTGLTIYCGSRQSEAYTRIYETYEKHEFHAFRIECEFKGEKAKNVCGYLLQEFEEVIELYSFGSDRDKENAASAMASKIAKLAIGQIDFIDRSEQYSNGSLEKCERLPFWQEMIDQIGQGIKIKVAAKKRTLRKVGDWILRQVTGTIARAAHGLTEGEFNDLIYLMVRVGSEKLKEEDEMWIAEIREQGLEGLFGTVAYAV